MYSTIHGAGRVMSLTAAIGKFVKDENGKKQRHPGLVRHDEMQNKLIADYRKCLKGTFKILHTVRPPGVVMTGKEIADPFRD